MSWTNLTSDDAKQNLRSLFDDEVINHGSYNVVFAHDHHTDSDLAGYLLGYRFAPLEMVVVPFTFVLDAGVSGPAQAVTAASVVGVDLTNLVDIADNGTSYCFHLSTGRSLLFEVSSHTVLPWPVAGTQQRVLVELEQHGDAEHFQSFVHKIFDRFDEFDRGVGGASAPA